MKLIFGLGNPKPEYRGTRHNLGFEIVDQLKDRWAPTAVWNNQWKSNFVRHTFDGEVVLLAKPVTFMNASGEAVAEINRYFKVASEETFVIVDDVALPLGKIRIKPSGSAGGHNGLKSVIRHLGTLDFPRMRVGVGRGDGNLADYVLGRFAPFEREVISAALLRAADATEAFIRFGINKAMNEYNAATDTAE